MGFDSKTLQAQTGPISVCSLPRAGHSTAENTGKFLLPSYLGVPY